MLRHIAQARRIWLVSSFTSGHGRQWLRNSKEPCALSRGGCCSREGRPGDGHREGRGGRGAPRTGDAGRPKPASSLPTEVLERASHEAADITQDFAPKRARRDE
jgi:hypothetical protein